MKIDLSYLNDEDTVIVATSGGPDSMCLLNLFLDCKKKINIICAHVNHKVRIESDNEYECVEKFCLEHNITFEGMCITDYTNDNFHNEARVKRYAFFKELIKKYHAKYLATAHHADDLMETILMKIERGSNLNGYAGFSEMKYENSYYVIRPLIHYTKQEIIDYMDQHHLWYAIDASNLTDHYTRNRYRHTVLPFLKNEDPLIHEKYYKFSKELYRANEFIDHTIDIIANNVLADDVLNITEFNKLEDFVEERLIGRMLHKIYGDDLFVISDVHISNIIKMIKKGNANIIIDLPLNYQGIKNYNEFRIIPINNDETFNIEFNDYLVINDYTFTKTNDPVEKSNYVIRLNSKELKLPLAFRNRVDGDKMTIKNMTGSKKIKDILINEKINIQDRNNIPLLVDNDNNIIWIPGIKKSQFDKDKTEIYDIIIKCERKK